ncbi:MAG: hypothetical protein CSA58_07870 [Micrococcales bacterium]|nr:MAG: hypothetical protein CSA58_07870 [Micrococcales bacterium]
MRFRTGLTRRTGTAAGCLIGAVLGACTAPERPPTPPSSSLPSSPPSASAPGEPDFPSYIGPARVIVIAGQDVIETPDTAVRCWITPPTGGEHERVDCTVQDPDYPVPDGNPGCPDWGRSVRLSATPAVICSAPLPSAGAVRITPPATVRVGQILCVVTAESISCQHERTGAAFDLARDELDLRPAPSVSS